MKKYTIINLTILECKLLIEGVKNEKIYYNKSNHIGM